MARPHRRIASRHDVFEAVGDHLFDNLFVELGENCRRDADGDEVAKKLSDKYAGKGIRVVHCNEFYDKVGADFDKWLADNGYPAGSHASLKDTSELLYLGGDQGWVRKDLIATAVGDPNADHVNNGIEGDARRSAPEIGKKVSDMKVDYAVDQIRRLPQ